MVVALVGATGLVGKVMMQVLEERELPVTRFIPAASERSVGREVVFRGEKHRLAEVGEALKARPQIVLFSAGAAVSRQYARAFADAGAFVIDNSSAWRAHEDVPLVVPEVNAHTINRNTKIIANPNCSTIQMVLVVAPLHKHYGVKRLVISTYQSVTGTGVKAVTQLFDERSGKDGEKAYPHPIDLNCFPHGGDFLDNGYTAEEMKLVHETRKILASPGMKITATVVRIPVTGGHSESVNIELSNAFDMADVRQLLASGKGLAVQDNPAGNIYPMPLYAEGRDEVFVGRIRRDTSVSHGLDLWIVADNLRKGAATNAVQIAEHLLGSGLITR
ncbi:MAG: aspartate-semialdehyde dehydrogenase [Bacteroidales bacterium]|nr:aspartate-semialdehyde dehydrogenase [Bacteroidales bacterium]